MITKNTRLNNLIRQLSKFGFVGGLTTAFGMFSYYILLDIYQLPLYPVYIGVYIVAVFFSYLLNSRFTFKEKVNVKDGIKYYASYLTSLGVGLVFLFVFDQLVDYSDFILVLITIPFRILVTFILLKTVVYPNTSQ